MYFYSDGNLAGIYGYTTKQKLEVEDFDLKFRKHNGFVKVEFFDLERPKLKSKVEKFDLRTK